MAKASGFLRPPSVWYWILSVLPLLSYALSALVVYTEWTGATYPAVPYLVAGVHSGPYIFGPATVVVVVSLFAVSWRAFSVLTKSGRNAAKTAAQLAAAYGTAALGFASAVLYAAMAFFQVQGPQLLQCRIHIAALASASLFVVAATLTLVQAKRIKVDWRVWAYDVATLVLETAYGVVALGLAKTQPVIIALCIIGYVVIGLAFARFALLGKHLLGANFAVPFAALRRV